MGKKGLVAAAVVLVLVVVATSGADVQVQRGRLQRNDPTLDDGSYFNAYSFAAQRGERIEIDLFSDDFDTYLIVVTPAEDELSDDDGGDGTDSFLAFEADEPGRYVLFVNSYDAASTGRYTLEISGGRDLTPVPMSREEATRARGADRRDGDASITDRLEAGDARDGDGKYFDVYEFYAEEGARLRIAMNSDAFDAFLRLRSPAGREWTDDDGGDGRNALLRLTAEESGVYEVACTSYEEGAVGAYELIVRGASALQTSSGAARDQRPAVQRSADGRTYEYRGELRPGDNTLEDGSYYHEYTVNARRGQRIAVDMTSAQFDPYLFVISPSGAEWSDDDGGRGNDASLAITADAGGSYVVRANSYAQGETGAYQLTVVVYDLGATQTLRGRLEEGDLRLEEDNSYYDRYLFQAQRGDRIDIDMISEDFDTYLMVLTPSGATYSNDDGGSGTNSSLAFTADESGDYVLIANSYSEGAVGAYELMIAGAGELREDRVSTASAPQRQGDRDRRARRSDVGSEIIHRGRLSRGDETLDDGSYFHTYTFQAQSGQKVVVRLNSSDFDCYLFVDAPSAGRRYTEDDFAYHLFVGAPAGSRRSSHDDRGGYLFVDAPTSASGRRYTDDDSGGGTNALVEFIAPESGAYTVTVNSYKAGETGAYELIIEVG